MKTTLLRLLSSAALALAFVSSSSAASTTGSTATADAGFTFAAAGQHVTFFVTVDGAPTPTLEWFKDGVKIEGATGLTYVIPSYVPATHAGVYTVKATNIVGTATSKPETLATGTAPTINLRVEVKITLSASP